MSRSQLVCVLVALLALSLQGGPSQAQDPPEFHSFLLPATSVGEVGDTVTVAFEVDETAVQFNGYGIEILWDPDIVSGLSVTQGSLMLDACENNPFTYWEFTDSTVFYSHVLLCTDLLIDGPGILSLFDFRIEAEGTSPLTILTDPDFCFAEGGYHINPQHPTFPRQVVLHDGQITTEDLSGVDDGVVREPSGLTVRVQPNPVLDATWLELRAPIGDRLIDLDILDVSGRSVRSWSLRPVDDGRVRQRWDATDGQGRALPNGTYFFLARSESSEEVGKIQVVR